MSRQLSTGLFVARLGIPAGVLGMILGASFLRAQALTSMLPEPPAATLSVAPKQLLILRPGLDAIWGSYIFAVQNEGATPRLFKGLVMLPKETVDFQAQDGLAPGDVTIAPAGEGEGGVIVDKEIPSGVQVMSIGFKVDGELGKAMLTFKAVAPVENLNVLIPKDANGATLVVESKALTIGGDDATPDPQYVAMINRAPLATGEVFTISVSGIPEGRRRLWGIVIGVAVLLLAGGGLLAIRSRPRIQEGNAQAFIIS